MSLLARQREARQAEAEQRRDQVERRLRWSAPAGMSAADVGRRLGWPVGAETVLRELAEEGRAHHRDGVWYLGPGRASSEGRVRFPALGAPGVGLEAADDIAEDHGRSSPVDVVATVPRVETPRCPSADELVSNADELGAGEAPAAVERESSAAAISPRPSVRPAGRGQPVGARLTSPAAAVGADTERQLGPAAPHGDQAQPAPAMPEASTSGRLIPRSVGRAGVKSPTEEVPGHAREATGAAHVRSASSMHDRAGESADTTSEEAPAVLPVPSPPSPAAGDGVEPRAEAGPMEGGAPLHVGDESPGRVAAPEHPDEPPAAPAGETETRSSERAPHPPQESPMKGRKSLIRPKVEQLLAERPHTTRELAEVIGCTPAAILKVCQAMGAHSKAVKVGRQWGALWSLGAEPTPRKAAKVSSAPAAAGSSVAAAESPGVDPGDGAEGLETDQGSIASAPSSDPAGGAPASGAAPGPTREAYRTLRCERDDLRARVLGLEQERAHLLDRLRATRGETMELRSQLREALGDEASLHDDEDLGALAARVIVRAKQDRLEVNEEIGRRLDRSALEEAADEIARICGCPTWDYPGQLIRDVRALADERDALRLERDLAVRAQKEADSLHLQSVDALAHLGRWLVATHTVPEPEAEGSDAHIGRALAVLMGARL